MSSQQKSNELIALFDGYTSYCMEFLAVVSEREDVIGAPALLERILKTIRDLMNCRSVLDIQDIEDVRGLKTVFKGITKIVSNLVDKFIKQNFNMMTMKMYVDDSVSKDIAENVRMLEEDDTFDVAKVSVNTGLSITIGRKRPAASTDSLPAPKKSKKTNVSHCEDLVLDSDNLRDYVEKADKKLKRINRTMKQTKMFTVYRTANPFSVNEMLFKTITTKHEGYHNISFDNAFEKSKDEYKTFCNVCCFSSDETTESDYSDIKARMKMDRDVNKYEATVLAHFQNFYFDTEDKYAPVLKPLSILGTVLNGKDINSVMSACLKLSPGYTGTETDVKFSVIGLLNCERLVLTRICQNHYESVDGKTKPAAATGLNRVCREIKQSAQAWFTTVTKYVDEEFVIAALQAACVIPRLRAPFNWSLAETAVERSGDKNTVQAMIINEIKKMLADRFSTEAAKQFRFVVAKNFYKYCSLSMGKTNSVKYDQTISPSKADGKVLVPSRVFYGLGYVNDVNREDEFYKIFVNGEKTSSHQFFYVLDNIFLWEGRRTGSVEDFVGENEQFDTINECLMADVVLADPISTAQIMLNQFPHIFVHQIKCYVHKNDGEFSWHKDSCKTLPLYSKSKEVVVLEGSSSSSAIMIDDCDDDEPSTMADFEDDVMVKSEPLDESAPKENVFDSFNGESLASLFFTNTVVEPVVQEPVVQEPEQVSSVSTNDYEPVLGINDLMTDATEQSAYLTELNNLDELNDICTDFEQNQQHASMITADFAGESVETDADSFVVPINDDEHYAKLRRLFGGQKNGI